MFTLRGVVLGWRRLAPVDALGGAVLRGGEFLPTPRSQLISHPAPPAGAISISVRVSQSAHWLGEMDFLQGETVSLRGGTEFLRRSTARGLGGTANGLSGTRYALSGTLHRLSGAPNALAGTEILLS